MKRIGLMLNARQSRNTVVRGSQEGFILPMIVVSGTILLIVLGFAMQTIAVSRSNLHNQHLQMLTRQAAESGLARAQVCIQANDQRVTWSNSQPLRPNTDCRGNVIAGMSPYATENSSYKMSFVVYPSDVQDNFRDISSVGTADVQRKPTGQSMRNYNHTSSAYVLTGLTFDEIAFGSVYAFGQDIYSGNVREKKEAVYFFTRSLAGAVNGVGSNIDDVLRGYHNALGLPMYENGINLKMPIGVKVKKIFTDFQGGGWNAYFLTEDNQVFTTGINSNSMMANGLNVHGQLGAEYGFGDPMQKPLWQGLYHENQTKMLIPDGKQIDRIYSNGSVAFYITKDKKLYGFGRNWSKGIVGCYSNCWRNSWADYEQVNVPTKVFVYDYDEKRGMYIDRDNKDFNSIYTDTVYVANVTTSCATTVEGRAFCWGNNARRQIAQDSRDKYNIGYRIGYFGKMGRRSDSVVEQWEQKAIDAKTDGLTVYVLTDQGKVYAQGYNRYGQAGNCPTSNHNCTRLSLIEFPTGSGKIKKMAVDAFSALFLDEFGQVYGLGLNDAGQLGADLSDKYTRYPVKYQLPDGVLASDIFITSPSKEFDTNTGGGHHSSLSEGSVRYRNSFVVTTAGDVYGSGSNYYGQLGTKDSSARAKIKNRRNFAVRVPVKMHLYHKDVFGNQKSVVAKYVRAGMGTAIVISNKNKVYTVGHNNNGQLGSGDRIDRSIPEAHRLTNRWDVWYY